VNTLAAFGILRGFDEDIDNMAINFRANTGVWYGAGLVEGETLISHKLDPNIKTFKQWVIDNKEKIQSTYK